MVSTVKIGFIEKKNRNRRIAARMDWPFQLLSFSYTGRKSMETHQSVGAR